MNRSAVLDVVSRVSLVGTVLAVVACGPSAEAVANGDDPVAALKSPTVSSRYTVPFWTRAVREQPAVWQEAKAYCLGPDGLQAPNCAPVREVEIIERMAAPKPARPGIRLRTGGTFDSQPPSSTPRSR
jgi:hypothetical protein